MFEVGGQNKNFTNGLTVGVAGSDGIGILLANKTNAAPWYIGTGGALWSGGPFGSVYDDCLYWGFNAQNGGAKIVAGVPKLGLSLESNYNDGVSLLMEYNFDFGTTAAAGNSWRPMAFQVEKTSGTIAQWVFRIGSTNASNTNSQFLVTRQSDESQLMLIRGDSGWMYLGNGQFLIQPVTSGNFDTYLRSTNAGARLISRQNNKYVAFSPNVEGLEFGISNDANLYRTAANSLKTDGSFAIVGNVGFYNTAPVAKPTVSGAKGSNAALASLMTALSALGLVTDSTSA